jgi:predicted transcriptional regulator
MLGKGLSQRFVIPVSFTNEFPVKAELLSGAHGLRNVRRHEVRSIRALAIALGRDYSNVHPDVQALINLAGLLDISGEGVRADYDMIETKIRI